MKIRQVTTAAFVSLYQWRQSNRTFHYFLSVQIAVSATHQLVVTSEKLVYGWGDNSYGQLGVGDNVSRPTPCLIEVLTGKSVSKLAAGIIPHQ